MRGERRQIQDPAVDDPDPDPELRENEGRSGRKRGWLFSCFLLLRNMTDRQHKNTIDPNFFTGAPAKILTAFECNHVL